MYLCVSYNSTRKSNLEKKQLLQTNIFNIFPSSVTYNTVAKILQSNCIQRTKKDVPAPSMWLNRVFSDLANTDEQHCLITDCSGINKNGSSRYRTQADDPVKQICYFNKPSDDVFISNWIKEIILPTAFILK